MAAPRPPPPARLAELPGELNYIQYEHSLEAQYLPAIRALISKDLSEPYSIYVYRYFLYQWGHLCYMALDPADTSLVGVIICKLEPHASHSPPTIRGYIAMLAVSSAYRGHGIATALVKKAIDAMAGRHADEVVLETEESNTPAMRLYERLGFLRSKKLHRYYLNGSSAYRLVLSLKANDPDAALDYSLGDHEEAVGVS
ncbi:N-terminal acetyltransferase C complex catalytic subunit MAK3 [Podospora appendiculata]|uniref:N-terminal acetyltransferase C complex catalytic subunit MAK3 n=1 Tax=Podospora appendiculata TaxID=314037 RepID=A0AAE0XCB7_9PEZI|nr:N-terminal acetyltransferase C complex catalytic subunit MAK3 [Podospora appendiculata]